MERELLDRLLSQAFLYDDPHAYKAGVQAAWGALAVMNTMDQPAGGGAGPATADTRVPRGGFTAAAG